MIKKSKIDKIREGLLEYCTSTCCSFTKKDCKKCCVGKSLKILMKMGQDKNLWVSKDDK